MEGKHDYHSPQIYWDIANNPKFDVLVRDWKNNSYGRHIYAGSAAYRMDSGSGNWSASEILAQIDTSRAIGVQGNTFFRYKSLLLKGLIDSLINSKYKYPAFIYPMPWIDSVKPNPPINVAIRRIADKTFEIFWAQPQTPPDGDSVKYYAIYRSENSPVDIDDIKNLLAVVGLDRISYSDVVPDLGKNYFYVVTAFDKLHNESNPSNEVSTVSVVVAEAGQQILKFELYQNYPNPFNFETTIEFEIPFDSWVSVKIYDILGREIKTLVSGFKSAGRHKVIWDGRDEQGGYISSGVYFCRMTAGSFSKTIKIVLTK
jgi:hypothetical protein